MGQLEDMAMFVRVVDAGSITKAADQLNIAKSAVSRRLKELETRLNSQLISRTTRNSTLTEAGQKYYHEACSIVSEVDLLNEQISGVTSYINGTMRLTAPLSFGLMHLDEIIHNFALQHPKLSFELDFSDRHIDLVEEGYEMAIRIGELKDSSYQAKRLTVIRRILCASPEYLKQAGTPDSIEALKHHSFLQYGLKGKQGELEVIDPSGQRHRVDTTSRIKANNGNFILDMAIKGHGIAFTPTFIAYQSLAKGELIPIMQDYQFPTLNAYAVYPKNRFLSQRCRLLIDYIIEQIGDEPYWDNI
ncbi:LysR family transcriptional regulator [Psychrobacter sp.]|uniref:LysR family transcriptional regulator n=1 Tax=Psychrobacter sp. TaxID=56811 RepID=UPI0025CD8F91|nr:LysR family transcriptional regulator [Psychrobacter sp.]